MIVVSQRHHVVQPQRLSASQQSVRPPSAATSGVPARANDDVDATGVVADDGDIIASPGGLACTHRGSSTTPTILYQGDASNTNDEVHDKRSHGSRSS